jgi:hypothetical protein
MLSKLKKFNRIQKISLIVLLLVLLCRIGGLSYAWFTSNDSVTNVFGLHDYYIDIVLSEPNWDSVGRSQAATMQPGMDIFKDPRVTNITSDDCFVRVKIIVADSSGNELSDGDQKTAILKSIKFCTDDNGTGTVADDTFNPYPTLNTNFTPKDGWYYYTASEDNGKCTVLTPGATTPPLFTDVKIPEKKAEYKYFKDGFVITVVAEGVFCGGVTDASIDNVKKRFEDMSDTEDTSESTTSETTDKNISESTTEATSENSNGNANENTGNNTGGSSNESPDGSSGAGIGGNSGTSGITSAENESSKVMVAYSTAKFGSNDTIVSGSAIE